MTVPFYPAPEPIEISAPSTPTHPGADLNISAGHDVGAGAGNLRLRNLKHQDPGVPDAVWVDPNTGQLQLSGAMGATSILASGSLAGLTYLDLPLPATFSGFQLKLWSVIASDVNEAIAAAFSPDGGTTFFNDANNGDTYEQYSANFGGNNDPDTGTSVSDATQSFADALINMTKFGGPAMFAELTLYPGQTDGYPASFQVRSLSDQGPAPAGGGLLVATDLVGRVSIYATAVQGNRAQVFKRVNLLRIMPYGAGDSNPPTGGDTFTTGTYTLWGYR